MEIENTFNNKIIEEIKNSAQEVFDFLGAGHTEAVYESALEIELVERNLGPVRRQVPTPIYYKGYLVGFGHIDILMQDVIILELKSVTKLTNKDETQLRKYLAGMALQTGLLINFNPGLDGIEVLEIERDGETYS